MIGLAEKRMKYALIVPVVVFILVVAIFPLLFSLYMMLSIWQPGTGGIQFVGFANFKAIGQDARFWHALWLSFVYVAILLTLELCLGTLIATVLQKEIGGKNFFRVSYMLPMLLSPVAVSYIWKMIFDYNRGPANHFLSFFGIQPVEWLSGEISAIISLVIVDVWQWTPFMILTILAAFEALPEELFEAAVVDGASPVKIFQKITLPLALPVIVTIVLLRTIDAFKVFDTIYILTGGGPGTATELLNFYIYLRGFRAFDLGYGTAMSWVQLIVIIAMFMFFIRSLKRIGALR
ncbi:MAG: sugar ABC transporter permease [Spirochaetes bacterium]|nr:sugar ABC transporter permease [Spirochaetota bacterium]